MLRRGPVALALALLVAGCGGKEAEQQQAGGQARNQVLSGKEAGVTPMAERVAVIGIINKRNGIVHDLRMKPGQSVRVKDAVVRLKACETTAPWEAEKLTGAFLQLEVEGSDGQWRRVFSGWVYKESPSLNVVEHPVYDVWPKSCAMTYPSAAGEPAAPVASSNRSSARISGEEERDDPAADAPAGPSDVNAVATEPAPLPAPPPPSAPESNDT